MTVSEFKAWLDGFSEAIDGVPTAEQWAKIKAKVNDLRSNVVPSVPPHFPAGVRPRLGEPMVTWSVDQNVVS